MMTEEKIYSLCEAVADIAYIAGERNFSTGDSRADMAEFIFWAKEFEKRNEGVEWGVSEGEEKDYIEAICEFANAKLDEVIGDGGGGGDGDEY